MARSPESLPSIARPAPAVCSDPRDDRASLFETNVGVVAVLRELPRLPERAETLVPAPVDDRVDERRGLAAVEALGRDPVAFEDLALPVAHRRAVPAAGLDGDAEQRERVDVVYAVVDCALAERLELRGVLGALPRRVDLVALPLVGDPAVRDVDRAENVELGVRRHRALGELARPDVELAAEDVERAHE